MLIAVNVRVLVSGVITLFKHRKAWRTVGIWKIQHGKMQKNSWHLLFRDLVMQTYYVLLAVGIKWLCSLPRGLTEVSPTGSCLFPRLTGKHFLAAPLHNWAEVTLKSSFLLFSFFTGDNKNSGASSPYKNFVTFQRRQVPSRYHLRAP